MQTEQIAFCHSLFSDGFMDLLSSCACPETFVLREDILRRLALQSGKVAFICSFLDFAINNESLMLYHIPPEEKHQDKKLRIIRTGEKKISKLEVF